MKKEVIMEKLEVGSKLEIHCYKHNGKIHRTWDESIVLDIKGDLLICGNNRVTVTERDGRSHKTRETAIIFFYTKRWFNVFAQFKKQGLYYKCNIATPYLIDDNIILNNRDIISPNELDIYVPSRNIAFEYDGLYWHSNKFVDKDYHLSKKIGRASCRERV